MSYNFQLGFSRSVSAPVAYGIAGETGLGAAIVIPATPYGAVISSAHGRVDASAGAATNFLRLTMFSGTMSPEGLIAWANAILATFAQVTAGGPTDPVLMNVWAEDVAQGLTVRGDMTGTYTTIPEWTFGTHGVEIGPNENAIALLTPLYKTGIGAPGNVGSCTLMLTGRFTTAAQAAANGDVGGGAGPARFGNSPVAPTLR